MYNNDDSDWIIDFCLETKLVASETFTHFKLNFGLNLEAIVTNIISKKNTQNKIDCTYRHDTILICFVLLDTNSYFTSTNYKIMFIIFNNFDFYIVSCNG